MKSKDINCIADESYLNLLPEVNFSPIFIMGDHRSGTTLLYKTLVATEYFNFVRAYHVIKYDEILFNHVNHTENHAHQELKELLKSLGMKDRVIDNVEVTPDLPEEYGFILKNAGYESHLNTDNLALFTQLCRKIQFISNPDKPLLLKNPWCFPHFIYIKNAFPEAKFIFIHRHPIHVINSKLKATRSILTARNAYTSLLSQQYVQIFENPMQRFVYRLFYSTYFDLGLRRVTEQSVQSTTYFLQNVDSLQKTNYVSVKYEDLCKQPEATIHKIMGFLGLEQKSTLAYDTLIEPRPLKLLPEVERKNDEIRHKLQPYFTYHGYE
ncbi:MAG TPA: sulfotransferase [Cyanobacteria bacterium UBA8553]|nr:sulfotransferase [Cyanobacteria bacterium UBA8553]HAJ59312.1 sulfotransferase [Cyanobacteria bacterium UBA8543]